MNDRTQEGVSPDDKGEGDEVGRSPSGRAGRQSRSRDASPPSRATIPSAGALAKRLVNPRFQRRQAVEKLATRLGFLLRMERIEQGYTVAELARRGCFKVTFIEKVERGEYHGDLGRIGELGAALSVEILPHFSYRSDYRAQGGEARRAETTGSAREHPVAEGHAPNPDDHSPTTDKQED